MAKYNADELEKYVGYIHNLESVTKYISTLVGAAVFGIIGFLVGGIFGSGYGGGDTQKTGAIIGALLGGFIAYRIAELAGAWLMIASHSALCLREIEQHLRTNPAQGVPSGLPLRDGASSSFEVPEQNGWTCRCGKVNGLEVQSCTSCHRSKQATY